MSISLGSEHVRSAYGSYQLPEATLQPLPTSPFSPPRIRAASRASQEVRGGSQPKSSGLLQCGGTSRESNRPQSSPAQPRRQSLRGAESHLTKNCTRRRTTQCFPFLQCLDPCLFNGPACFSLCVVAATILYLRSKCKKCENLLALLPELVASEV